MNDSNELPESEYLEITAVAGSIDSKVLRAVINMGIDSKLEAFTLSKFNVTRDDNVIRLVCSFYIDEMSILIRRLIEFSEHAISENQASAAEMWADDIVTAVYGQEII